MTCKENFKENDKATLPHRHHGVPSPHADAFNNALNKVQYYLKQPRFIPKG